MGEQGYEHNLGFIRLVNASVFNWNEHESKSTKAHLLMQRSYRGLWIKGEKTGKNGKKIGEKIPLLECSAKRLTLTLRNEYDLAVNQNKKYEENLKKNHPLDYLTLLKTKKDVDDALFESAIERVAIVLSDMSERDLSSLSEKHGRGILGAFYVEPLFRTA